MWRELGEGTVISTPHSWQRAMWWVLWHFTHSFYYRSDSMSSCVCVHQQQFSLRSSTGGIGVCVCQKYIFLRIISWHSSVSSVSLLSNGAHIFRFFLFYSSQFVVWVRVETTWEFNFFRSFHFFAEKFSFEAVLAKTFLSVRFVYFFHTSYWRKSIAAREWNTVRSTNKPWIWIYRVRHWALQLVLPEHYSSATVFTSIKRDATIQNTRKKSEKVSNPLAFTGNVRAANYVI